MDIHELQKIVHKPRDSRRTQTLPKYSPAERDTLIKKYHPDHRESAYRPIKFGANAGELTVRELAALQKARARFRTISTWRRRIPWMSSWSGEGEPAAR